MTRTDRIGSRPAQVAEAIASWQQLTTDVRCVTDRR